MNRWSTIIFAIAVFSTGPALAQEISIDFDQDQTLSRSAISVFFLVALIGIIPGLIMAVTCFPFIITVLSILRQALGLQQAPPNMLIVSLALFLTYFVMDPVFQDAWNNSVKPLLDGDIEVLTAFNLGIIPFKDFMASRVDRETLLVFFEMRDLQEVAPSREADYPLSVLIPSFIVSEIELAFKIGFLIFIPFLVIDLVVAAILMSMGMMMVPPAIVSLPFKLAFFVVADGWILISTSLVQSYF